MSGPTLEIPENHWRTDLPRPVNRANNHVWIVHKFTVNVKSELSLLKPIKTIILRENARYAPTRSDIRFPTHRPLWVNEGRVYGDLFSKVNLGGLIVVNITNDPCLIGFS